MKKFIALLLALMMALVCVSALAADGEPVTNPEGESPVNQPADGEGAGDGASTSQVTPIAASTITITKKYTVEGNDDAINPADTLKFVPTSVRVDNATSGVTVPAITIADVTVDKDEEEATITIQLPAYTAVGEYYYTIKETDTGVAGVTYLADTIYLRIQVLQDPNSKKLVFGGRTFRLGSETATQKIDSFNNKYEAGTLTVSKTVSGNMGDLDKEWNFKVVFTAPSGDTVMGDITTSATNGATAPDTISAGTGWTGTTTKESTFKLISGQSVTFSNIPKGVTYTVAEAEAGADGYTTKVGDTELKSATDTVSGSIAGSEDDTVAVTNTKNVDIDTGVTLDSAVYMLIMALALAGFVALKVRRREDY